MDVRFETLAAIPAARVHHIGPYEAVGPSFARSLSWAAEAGVVVGRVVTLSYDNPETPPPAQVRSDACIELRGEAAPAEGIALESVGAGRYAVHPYRGIAPAYRRLFREWLPNSGEAVDDRPCMEINRNSPPDTPEAEFVTDLYVLLRAVCED